MDLFAISFLSLSFVFTYAARGRKKKYSDEFVIKKVRERKQEGKSVDPRFVPVYLYQLAYQRHENWGQVLRKAGLDPKEEKHRKEHINQVLRKVGYIPEEVSITEQSVHWPEGIVVNILQQRRKDGRSIRPKDLPVFIYGLIQYRFDGWDEAVREAGLHPPTERRRTA